MKSGGNRPRLRLTACARARYLHTVKGGRVPIEHDLLSADRHTNGPFSRRQQHASIPKPAGVGMCPFRTGHASISGSVKRELVSIRDSDTRGMRLLHIRHASYSASADPGHASISHSAKPTCVHFRRGMRLFQLRLNASLCPFRARMSGACVHIGLDSTPACVHFRLGRSRHASITASDTRDLRLFSIRQDQHASIARAACINSRVG